MTHGLVLTPVDLKNVATKVKLFNGQTWNLAKGYAERYVIWYEDGKPTEIVIGREKVDKIFPKIKLLFDKKNTVIAQRPSADARLITTRENHWLKRENKRKEPSELAVYGMIEMIEKQDERLQTTREKEVKKRKSSWQNRYK